MGYFTAWVMSGGNGWLTIFIHIIVCLSFLLSGMSAISSRGNETDRLALLEFKAKITYDPLGIMRLWNETTPFCQWYGVACGFRHQRVIALNLYDLKLGGSISPHIGNLSFLRSLQLTNNSFIHGIPPEIDRLRRLKVLNLYNSSLGGEIPPNLTSCSELKVLDLASNKLEGKIPPELGSLSKLHYFGVESCNLTGPLPTSLGNLTSLEEMYVNDNNLVGTIPKSLGSLSHLRELFLSMNSLSGKVPSSVFNLSSLEALGLGGNQLRGHLPPTLFHTLPNLQFLHVSFCQFSGPIPISVSNASNLQSFQITGNSFTGKVPLLEKLNMLEYFRVARNQLGSGVGAQDDLSFLCSLVNATSLKELDMAENNFGGILPGCISNLSSQLNRLAMPSNSISGSIPPGIDNLISLEELYFETNSFTGTIPPTIGNLKNLVVLVLLENNFSGQIPSSLGKLSKLNRLGLSSNNLEGTIPSSLGNCTSLEILVLDQNYLIGTIPPQVLSIPSLSIGLSVSQNRLTGPLPEEVGKLTNLIILDVSGNMLSGHIPDSLGDCTILETLNLDHNNFQGSIPSSLSSLKGLQNLDLSCNNLSGHIPEFFASFDLIMLNLSFNKFEGAVPSKGVFANASAISLKGNSELCGGLPNFQLPKCSHPLERKKRRLSTKAKVLIAVAAGLSVATLLILVSLLRRKRSQAEANLSPSENAHFPFVSYKDLHRATNGFSKENQIGVGSFGSVYKGIIGHEGQVVAIKVLNLKRLGATRSFLSECEVLRNIRHRNLVKILTVCSGVDYQGNDFKALVYDFMPNGSIEDWLHPPAKRGDETSNEQAPPRKLGLLQRLSIAIDVAALLEYAHHQFGNPLVHCDIKPSNILLDSELSGHVSDFGLAKFLLDDGIAHTSMHPSSSIGVRGTVGYAPPEYGVGSNVSTQGDVYSYGILLLEMFTGKRPTDAVFNEGLSLHLYAKLALPGRVVDILDLVLLQDLLDNMDQVWDASSNMLIRSPQRSIGKDTTIMDSLASLIEIGVACSCESPAERMDIDVVTAKLCRIRDNITKRKT